MKELLTVFFAVFLAELGDKTQIAALLFASDRHVHPVGVFLAASLALVVSTLLAVVIGHTAARYLEVIPIKLVAGIAFVGLGAWMVLEALPSVRS